MKKLVLTILMLVGSAVAQIPFPAGQPYQVLKSSDCTATTCTPNTTNLSGTLTGGFPVSDGVGYYKISWTTNGTVASCSVSLDSRANQAASWSTGGIVAAATIGSCASAGSYTLSSNPVYVNFARATPTITCTGSCDVTFTLIAGLYPSSVTGSSSGGSGVTSVTFTGDGIFDSSTPSSAVTTTGTLTATAIAQAANCVFAGPTSAGPSAPTCRALVAADLPLAGVPTNAQTGTTYTYLTGDRVSYVSFSNASAITVTLPQAGSAGFGTNWVNVSCDIGAGTATITPTTSTISYTNGSTYTSANATLALTTGQCAWIYSDNTNYFAIVRGGGGAVSSVNTLTGAVVIENATAGQVAISGGGSAALTGAADMTYATHTFATTTNGIFDWSAATGAGSFKLPAVVGGTVLAGTSTGNLSAPIVLTNTNSSNNNTSITMGITSPGTSTGQTTLNINGATTGGDLTDWGTGGTWASGVLSGQTILAKLGITGGFTGLNFTSNGTTAGFLDLPQGITSAAVAPCNTANSICIQAPTSVTSQLRVLASAPATGFSLFTNSSGTMTETISATSGTLTSGVGLLGTLALNAVLASTVANVAGHFTNLQVVTSLGGTCSTPPQFNVFDGTSNTGSTVTASASTQTKGNGTSTAQTQTFAAGDVIGIYISTAGGTCTTDQFTVTAQYSIP